MGFSLFHVIEQWPYAAPDILQLSFRSQSYRNSCYFILSL